MEPSERQRVISALKKAVDLVNERDDDYDGKNIWFDWQELDRICDAMNGAIGLLMKEDPKQIETLKSEMAALREQRDLWIAGAQIHSARANAAPSTHDARGPIPPGNDIRAHRDSEP